MRVGLIGCGRLGARCYIPAFVAARGVELVAIAEPDLGRRLTAGELAGGDVRTFGTGRSLVRAGSVEMVVLAGPPRTHLEHASVAAEAGVRALVEKPPGADAGTAAALAALEPAPWIGFNRRFGLAAGLLDAMPAAGGELTMELRYLRARWRPHSTRLDALDDLGTHLLDLSLLLGGPEEPRLRAVRLGPAAAVVELRGPRTRTLLRCASNRPWRESIALRDAAGRRIFANRLGGLPAALAAGRAGGPDPLTASLTAQLEAAARAVRGGNPGRLATAREGVRVMEAIEAVRCSAADGGSWQGIGEPDPATSSAAVASGVGA